MRISKEFVVIAAIALGGALALSGPAAASCDPSDSQYDEFLCGPKPAANKPEGKSAERKTASDESTESGKILTKVISEVPGPKRAVSVGRVNAIGAFTAKYGNWDIGGGLGAMLTTALVESGRFIVVERAHLQNILTEQEMKGNKLTNQDTGPEFGRLIGVQFLIFGSVTEFGTDDDGGGFSLGMSGGGIGSLLSGALSRQTASGTVAMDFRVVDTTTGQVLEAFTEKEQIDNSSWDVSVGYESVSLGTNQFYKTPLGAAARAVVTRAVERIAGSARETAWTGQVVEFDGGEVYINAGASSGLKPGDAFTIQRIVKKLTDPVTNEVLLLRKKELGIVEVKTVMPKVAFGPFQPLEVEKPKRGDLVIILKK